MKNPKQRNSNQKELDCIGNIQIISEYQDDKETGFSNDFQKDTCNTLELTKQNNDEEKSMEAYFMTIEIDKTHSKTLKIFNHIPPEEIAFHFCKAFLYASLPFPPAWARGVGTSPSLIQ